MAKAAKFQSCWGWKTGPLAPENSLETHIYAKKPRKYVHNIKDKNYVAKKLLSGGDIVMQKQKNIIIIL